MTTQTPVLIVGAGPGGLTAAATLAHYGIDFLLVERRPELSSLPRATGVSTRTMELMRSFGIEDEVRAGGDEVGWLQCICESLSRADAGQYVPTGFPSPEQCSLISPSAPACVPQDHLEPVLFDHVRSLGVGRMELGTELTGIERRPDAVRAYLGDDVVDARYLIAADGAHSRVRRALGIEMRGPDNLLGAVSALFRAPLWEVVGKHRYGIYIVTNPEAEGVMLPAGDGDRWLYGVVHPPDSPLAGLDEAQMMQRIEVAAGVPGLAPRIERVGSFTFAAQMADRYREGNAFLIGDAAHRATPRGGTGMNTAIHDGYDLGWKLAWVLNGWADSDLLDSYERERRPVAEHNVAFSAQPPGSPQQPPGHALAADLGGRIPHAWVDGPGHSVSTLDLLGAGYTLFCGPECDQCEVPARVPVTARRLDLISARALGLGPAGTRLVRPDGVPADASVAELRAAA
jgi:2-polyprenyl-6-methoxyphenol hydroxylase-like FAD-dependent oxidoreductase